MPIRREDPGLGLMYGEAARLAGKTIAAREAATRTMRQYDRGQQVQLAMLRMQNDNEMIRFREEMDLRTRKEAQLFQLEQIKTRANLDFAREEGDRQQLQDEVKQGLKAINEYPYMSDEEKAEAALNFRIKKLGGYTAPEKLSSRERELQLIEQIIGAPAAGAAVTGAGLPAGGQDAPDIRLDPYWPMLDDTSKMQLWQIYQDPEKLRMAIERLQQKYGAGETPKTIATKTTPDILTRLMRTEPAAWGIAAGRGL